MKKLPNGYLVDYTTIYDEKEFVILNGNFYFYTHIYIHIYPNDINYFVNDILHNIFIKYI